jgi:Tfp pilus assembly protein PilV
MEKKEVRSLMRISNQQTNKKFSGTTLLDALVALLLMTIVVVASATALSQINTSLLRSVANYDSATNSIFQNKYELYVIR